MGLDWMPREHGLKDHDRHGKENWGTEAPCTVYEKKPLTDPKGKCGPRPLHSLDQAEQPGPV